MSEALFHTALSAEHIARGAKMVPFAGYAMPLQYEGIVAEHLQVRAAAGLFDVSHMGQVLITASAQDLERVLPVDAQGMTPGRQAYGFFLNDGGGVEDDVMLTRREDDFYLVVNAARKETDFARLQAALGADKVQWWAARSLLALQGPAAVEVLAAWNPEVADLAFMHGAVFDFDGASCWVSRSGYSGEDGFEISLPDSFAPQFFNRLLRDERVKPCGLGARDSLRLEAGLCLYGNDLTPEISPLEAGLLWAVPKRRREEGGFVGAAAFSALQAQGVRRKRVGLTVEGRLPVRAHMMLTDGDGRTVGEITSGGFAPSLGVPVAMGYVESALATAGSVLYTEVRGKAVVLTVTALPFVKKSYKQ